jgi:uncharacterized protein YuzE
MIRTNYDPKADVLHVAFGAPDAQYDGAQEVAPGVFVEFDAEGNAIGVEVLSVALRSAGTYGQRAKVAAE